MEAPGLIFAFDYTKDRHILDKFESSGRCVNDTETKTVDLKTKKLMGPNKKGEIYVKNPYSSSGYSEGFIETGDVGYYDEDECLHSVDRIKDMFKYQMWHVIPSSLEDVFQEHRCIKEAVVFGITHEIDCFWPPACVILKDCAETDEKEIDNYLVTRVAEYQKLRGGIRIVKSLARSPNSKLQRFEIK